MKVKIRSIVKDFPAVAYRLGFLQNFTHTQQPSLASDSVVKKDLKKENVVGDEKRKHDEEDVNGDRADGPRAGEEGDAEKQQEEYVDVEEDQLESILKEVCTGFNGAGMYILVIVQLAASPYLHVGKRTSRGER